MDRRGCSQQLSMKKVFYISLVAVIGISGCYYDSEEDLYPAVGACDTTNSSFSTVVNPLLQANGCLGCHSGIAPSGNISLQGYANVKVVAQNGKLYGVINHLPGFSPMPQGGNKLTACSISRIKAWIDAGAPNN
jgi:hypothetical protein